MKDKQGAQGDSPGIIWTDVLVLEFAKLSSQGSLTGIFEGCRRLTDKLKRFKSMKTEHHADTEPPEADKPILPRIFATEVSLSAIASSLCRIADTLEQTNREIDGSGGRISDALTSIVDFLTDPSGIPDEIATHLGEIADGLKMIGEEAIPSLKKQFSAIGYTAADNLDTATTRITNAIPDVEGSIQRACHDLAAMNYRSELSGIENALNDLRVHLKERLQ